MSKPDARREADRCAALPAGVSVAPVAGVDPEAAAALLGESMTGGFGRRKSAALWRWKHQQNPAGQSLGLAAYDGLGNLIGLRPFMRWRLVDAACRPVTAVRAVDTAVALQWRGHGIFSALTRCAVEQLIDNRIELVFNTPNEKSAPGYRKMGWRLLGHPTVWVAPRIGRRRSGNSPARRLSSEVPAPGIAARSDALPVDWPPVAERLDELAAAAARGSAADPAAAAGDGSDAGTVGGIHASSDTTTIADSDAVPARAPLRVIKDRAFLEWRYAGHPNMLYRVIALPLRDGRRAFAVVRADERGRRAGIALCELFAEGRAPGAWRGVVAAIRSAAEADYLVTAAPPGRIAAVACGFLPVRWRNVQLGVRPLAETATARWTSSRGGWSLSLGDLEGF